MSLVWNVQREVQLPQLAIMYFVNKNLLLIFGVLFLLFVGIFIVLL